MSSPDKSFADIFNRGFWEGQQKFSDVTLQTNDGTSFKTHRIILSQRSGYFRAYFSFNENQETVLIPNVQSNILESILLYIYTGAITLDEKNIWNLMIASDYLLLDDLLKICRSFTIRSLSCLNCLSSLAIAWEFERSAIIDDCFRYTLVHFEEILKTSNEGLEDLPFEVFKMLLDSNSLNVSSERSVWKALVRWTEADFFRFPNVPELLTCLKLEEETDEELAAEILSHAIITNNPCCLDFMLRAKSNSYLTKCSILSRFGETCSRNSPSSSNARVPNHVYIIARHTITDTKCGSEIFLTYDGELDFWRPVVETDFIVDTMVRIGRFIYMLNVWENVNAIFDMVEELFVPMGVPLGPCCNCVIITLKNILYSIGGSRYDGDSVSMMYSYYSDNDTWEAIEIPNRIVTYGADTLHDLIYIVGIEEVGPNPIMICRAFEPDTTTWSLIPPPNIYRLRFAVVAFHEKVFVIAGENDGHYLKTVEAYDPTQNKWTLLPDLPFQYFFPKAVVVDDKLIVYEYYNEDTRYYDVAPPLYWDEKTQLWQVIDESSFLFGIERYSFLVLDKGLLVKDITSRNRLPGIAWERILRV